MCPFFYLMLLFKMYRLSVVITTVTERQKIPILKEQ